MMIITQGKRSIAIPLTNIVRAREVDGGGWEVTDLLGEDHRIDDISWDIAVEGTATAMIAAASGTYLISPSDEPDVAKYWRENVLGWMSCADTSIRPVVIGPESLLSGPWQVLHPDGRVERSDGSSWETVDGWLEEVAIVRKRLADSAVA